jgi:hypothetical protein
LKTEKEINISLENYILNLIEKLHGGIGNPESSKIWKTPVLFAMIPYNIFLCTLDM